MKHLHLNSPQFKNFQLIPEKYTCQGKNISPPLHWYNTPKGTRCFVLIGDDPDAPIKTWVHWLTYDIPSSVIEMRENKSQEKYLENGGTQGESDFHSLGYSGPCPPEGSHRYTFRLYALDSKLNLPPGQNKIDVEKAMNGHIIEQATLVGIYELTQS